MAYVPENNKLEKKKVSIIPTQVNPGHLHANGGLLTPEEMAAIPKNLNTRISKKSANGVSYSVVAQGENIYAVYGNKVLLGKGGFGKVKLAQDVRTNEWVALKVISMQDAQGTAFTIDRAEREKAYLTKEVEMLHRITGKAVMVEDPNPEILKYHVIMKLENGSSADSLRQRHDLVNANNRLIIAGNMMKALNELHEQGIVHRDIKGANIIVNPSTNEVGIVDLGMADDVNNVIKDESIMGTQGYLAPEVGRLGAGKYSEKSDVYAMGVTLAKWLNLEVKLNKDSTLGRMVGAIKESKNFSEIIPDSRMRREFLNLIQGMCEKDVSKRLSSAQANVMLQAIIKKLDFSNVQTNTVGAVNVGEFKNLNAAEQKAMCDALMKFDRVVLLYSVNDQSVTDKELTKVHQFIRAAGVKCDDEVYGYSDTNKDRAIADVEMALNVESKSNMHVMHVTTNNSMYSDNFLGADDTNCKVVVAPDKSSDEYKQAMLNSHVGTANLANIKESLQKELLRVKAKYGLSAEFANREMKINAFIAGLERKSGPIQYKELAIALRDLAFELRKVNKSNHFMRFFKGATHTEKLVEEMNSAIVPKNKK